jgi:tetratricopeptide (TPR) repeat protein
MSKMDLTIWMLAALVVFSTLGFGAYYYYDRYGHTSQTVVGRELLNVEGKVRENPSSPELRVTAANFYLESGQTELAIQQGQQALTLNPNDQNALVILGRAYEKFERPQNAIDSFNQVVDLNRGNPLAKIEPRLEMVHYELGTLYAAQNQYDRAVPEFKLALEINRTDSDAHLALGQAYQKKNDHLNAATEFQETLRYTPDYVEAYDGLAASQTALGKSTEAAYARGMAQLLRGQTAEATSQMERLISQSPNATYAYYGLALAFERAGRREEAVRALQEFMKANPSDIAAQQVMGRLSKGK